MTGTAVHNSHLVASLYDAVVEPRQWPVFIRGLQDALDSAVVGLHMPMAAPGEPVAGVFDEFDAGFLDAYAEHYQAVDPFVPFLPELRVGEPQWAEMVITPAELEASEFYADWMKPQGFGAGGSICGMIDSHPTLGDSYVSIFRRDGRTLERQHMELVTSLMPHLRRAVHIQLRTDGLSNQQGALASTLDGMPTAVMLVARDGRVCHVNRTAEQLLRDRDGLRLSGGRLVADDPTPNARLHRLVSTATALREGGNLEGGGSLRLGRPSGRAALEVLVAPVRVSVDAFDRDPAEAAVFVTDPEATLAGADQVLKSLYGFTPSEAALARRLADGVTLARSADELGITVETARTRLKRLFAKTGTSRQTDLVRLMVRGPVSIYLADPEGGA